MNAMTKPGQIAFGGRVANGAEGADVPVPGTCLWLGGLGMDVLLAAGRVGVDGVGRGGNGISVGFLHAGQSINCPAMSGEAFNNCLHDPQLNMILLIRGAGTGI
jgi:hypothetical protein